MSLVLTLKDPDVLAPDRDDIAANAVIGESELVHSLDHIAVPRVGTEPHEMEEIVVMAPRQRLLGNLGRRLAGFMADNPRGIDLQLLPRYHLE